MMDLQPFIDGFLITAGALCGAVVVITGTMLGYLLLYLYMDR